MPVESDEIRRLLRNFAATVTIITVRAGNEIHGMAATAVCSVSLTPPLLLICVFKNTRTERMIIEAGTFAVNLLHQGQDELADRFAGRRVDNADRFAGLAYGQAVTGAPIFGDSLGYFDCRVVGTHDGGDHTIFVAQIVATGCVSAGYPLCYHQGDYRALSLASTSSFAPVGMDGWA